MSRLFFLALFLAVALDLSTVDAVLLSQGGRAVQWDDEEESVPVRRQRAGSGEERCVTAHPVVPRSVEPTRTQPPTEHRVLADRLDGPTRRQLPFRRALTPSVRSASPLDDH